MLSNAPFTLPSDSEVRLVCTARFPHLDSFRSMWWTVDGTGLENHPDLSRFTSTNR